MGLFKRENWNKLNSDIKENLMLELLGQLPEGFSFKGLESYSRYGQSIQTGVFLFQMVEFVFVPGDTVTLGWDGWQEGLNESNIDWLNAFNIEPDEIDEYLKIRVSPVRTIEISPMIVEVKVRDIVWREVAIDCEEIREDERLMKFVDDFTASNYKQSTLDKTIKLVRNYTQITAFLYNHITYEEFLDFVVNNGFRLPTEDEWEYLCGGGSRTLFPWGDSIDLSMNLKHFVTEDSKSSREYDLEKPNHFGLIMAYDPYEMEVLMDSEQLLKGGDGGCSICGGGGIVAGYLPISTFFRDIDSDELNWQEDMGSGYIYYRRVLQIEDINENN